MRRRYHLRRWNHVWPAGNSRRPRSLPRHSRGWGEGRAVAQLWKPERDAVVEELSLYVRAKDFNRFNTAFALLNIDTVNIKKAVFQKAKEDGPLASSTPTINSNQEMNILKLESMMGRVNTGANPLSCLKDVKPEDTLLKKMLESSVLMQWIGPESKPSLEKLKEACGSNTGLTNSNMRKVLANRSKDIYYGMLCLIVCCYQSGLSDCNKIAGENNATRVGTNGKSPWHRTTICIKTLVPITKH